MDILKHIKILNMMGPQQREELFALLVPVKAEDGEAIIGQGQASTAMFFVVRGKVGVYRGTEGSGRIFLRTIEEGGHFGEIGLIEPGSRSATVHANGHCELLMLSADAFQKVLSNPVLATPLLHGLCRTLALRLNNVSARYAELSSSLF
jgi:CRP-like cAMP-binding protein